MLLSKLRAAVKRPLINAQGWRLYSTSDTSELRARLMDGVKSAMKARDTVASMTLRSVLSDVYAADKAAEIKVPTSAIINIMRKAVTRRIETAAKFEQASRQDLADKELREKEVLEYYLPSLLPEADIDEALGEVISQLPPEARTQQSIGQIFKLFYQKVDRTAVDTLLVKRRAEALLAQN